jgi:hypothetical protein
MEKVLLSSEDDLESRDLDLYVGPDETDSFISDSSEAMASGSDRGEEIIDPPCNCTTVAVDTIDSSLRSLSSHPENAHNLNDLAKKRPILVGHDSSITSVTSSSTVTPKRKQKLKKPPRKREFMTTQASFSGSESSDAYEEEDLMNSSDRKFIATEESQCVNDISLYRLVDRTQTWKIGGRFAVPTYLDDSSDSLGSDSLSEVE